MSYTLTSIACSLLSFPILFLAPLNMILLAIGLVLGLKAYWKKVPEQDLSTPQHHAVPGQADIALRVKLVAALPALFAVAMCIFELWFINATYRA